jgi:hypothetical protein
MIGKLGEANDDGIMTGCHGDSSPGADDKSDSAYAKRGQHKNIRLLPGNLQTKTSLFQVAAWKWCKTVLVGERYRVGLPQAGGSQLSCRTAFSNVSVKISGWMIDHWLFYPVFDNDRVQSS